MGLASFAIEQQIIPFDAALNQESGSVEFIGVENLCLDSLSEAIEVDVSKGLVSPREIGGMATEIDGVGGRRSGLAKAHEVTAGSFNQIRFTVISQEPSAELVPAA